MLNLHKNKQACLLREAMSYSMPLSFGLDFTSFSTLIYCSLLHSPYISFSTPYQSPTSGARTHAHPCPWVLGGMGAMLLFVGGHGCDVIIRGWAWVRCYCSWVGMGVILLFMGGHQFCASLHLAPNRSQTSRMQCNQEALRVEANDSERPFICPIQPRLGVGG
jgi:hypothetical protein